MRVFRIDSRSRATVAFSSSIDNCRMTAGADACGWSSNNLSSRLGSKRFIRRGALARRLRRQTYVPARRLACARPSDRVGLVVLREAPCTLRVAALVAADFLLRVLPLHRRIL